MVVGLKGRPSARKLRANGHRFKGQESCTLPKSALQQPVHHNNSQQSVQYVPLQRSPGQTEQGCDLSPVKVTRCSALLHVAGQVLAPELPQRRMSTQFRESTAFN